MEVIKRAVVIPDQHFPLHSQEAVNVVLKAIKMVKPDLFINLGDVGEFSTVSSWKYKKVKRPPLEYQIPLIDAEIKAINEGIDQFDAVLDKVGCKERYICAGNHDEWLDAFVDMYPYMGDYTFKKACKWVERGYKYREYNQPLKIGKLTFIHGAYTTMYHAKKHLEAYGENIIYGHVHDVQRHTLTKLGGTIGAWSLGCLKNMSAGKNKWLRGRLHNWVHAFAIVDWFNDGNFRVDVVEIHKGKTTVWGKKINGNGKKKK
jgi:predicted phosphodiesterase